MKNLIILDLDNTLIFASSDLSLPADILFHYSRDLIIYERPFAKEFVTKCRNMGDVIVSTTAVHDYAKKVCENLHFEPVEMFTREDCQVKGNRYEKTVQERFFEVYHSITIVDDLPEMWDEKSHKKCRIIQVPPFMGEADDEVLRKIRI